MGAHTSPPIGATRVTATDAGSPGWRLSVYLAEHGSEAALRMVQANWRRLPSRGSSTVPGHTISGMQVLGGSPTVGRSMTWSSISPAANEPPPVQVVPGAIASLVRAMRIHAPSGSRLPLANRNAGRRTSWATPGATVTGKLITAHSLTPGAMTPSHTPFMFMSISTLTKKVPPVPPAAPVTLTAIDAVGGIEVRMTTKSTRPSSASVLDGFRLGWPSGSPVSLASCSALADGPSVAWPMSRATAPPEASSVGNWPIWANKPG